jgi:hypothetical protein
MFSEETFRKLSRAGLERLEHQWSADARHKRTMEQVARDTLRFEEAEGFHKAASFEEQQVEFIRKIINETK